MNDLIEAGIDVFQFDQMEIYGSLKLANEFGNKTTFLSPVDIQKILPSGDRVFIEGKTFEVINNFKTICKGSLIVKDYPDYEGVGVKEEWADFARDIVLNNSKI